MKLTSLNGIIRNLSDFNAPKLWQTAEWFLDIRKEAYTVTHFAAGAKKLELECDFQQKHWVQTALRVLISLMTLFIAPIAAACIASYYRKRFEYEPSQILGVNSLLFDQLKYTEAYKV